MRNREETRRRKVLIVDDEPALLLSVTHVLHQDNDEYDVLMAKTGQIAREILGQNDIDVMVTDVRMPGLDGLDLLALASRDSPLTRVIVMTSFDIANTQSTALRLGCLHFVQKPFDLQYMRQLVRGALTHRNTFEGTLAELSPADVIQMLCLGGKTVSLRIVHDTDSGFVCVREGDLYHAAWNDLTGEEAFYAILRTAHGSFHTQPFPDLLPRNITGGWQHLLMEGMRRKDEYGAELSNAEVGEASTAVALKTMTSEAFPTESEDSDVGALIDGGFDAIRDGDFARARSLWQQALELEPGNRAVELNLRTIERIQNRRA